jgi:cytochrome c-type biogenesis protein CcmH/NrfF
MRWTLAVVAALAVAVPAAHAADCRSTLAALESELMCPTCKGETLSESSAPAAARVRAFVLRRCRAGDTKGEIKDQLVSQFGPRILAAPRKHGFDLLAWVLPLAGVAAGAVALAVLARRWARSREGPRTGAPGLNGRPPLDPELERRIDRELSRYD